MLLVVLPFSDVVCVAITAFGAVFACVVLNIYALIIMMLIVTIAIINLIDFFIVYFHLFFTIYVRVQT